MQPEHGKTGSSEGSPPSDERSVSVPPNEDDEDDEWVWWPAHSGAAVPKTGFYPTPLDKVQRNIDASFAVHPIIVIVKIVR